MLRSKWKIKIKTIFIVAITFGMIFTPINFLNYYSTSNQENSNIIRENVTTKEKLIEDQVPKASEYQEFAGNGEQLNVTLHQSYLNNSFNTILNTSDSNNNKFTLPCPTATSFNSSYNNFNLKDIYAPNKTLIVEDDSLGIGFESFIINNYYASFTPKGVGYIENISLLIKLIDIGDPANLTIRLYNSENDGGNIRPLNNLGTIVGVSNVTSDTYYWHKITNIHAFFNCSESYNDTLFLRVGTIGGSVYWDWSNDVGSDGIDEMIALDAGESPLQFSGNSIDLPLIMDFVPLNNTPKPSEIGLKINNTEVSDTFGNSGNWLKENEEYSDSDANLDFELTADWWNVLCNISNVQINYTKTDIRANSDFNILASGQDVNWTVTIPGGLNYFDSRIADFNTINFTIPETWKENTIKVFNDTTEETDLIKRALGNGYREVQVLNAGNGSYWYLTVNSTNLISSIDTYVSGVLLTPLKANFTNIIRFNVSFSEIISNGDLNLSIYSPIPRHLNHSNIIDISLISPSNEFLVSNWDISDNATDYGVFKAQMSWNNDTAAGFLDLFFTIIADTELIIISPASGQDLYDNELFNITIFYNNTGPNSGDIGITGAIITENSTLLGAPTPTGISGQYSLELNTTKFGYGWNYIEIGANKSFYHNQTVIFSFHHRINTSILPSDSYDFGDVIRGKTVSYNFSYIDILTNPILGAIIREVNIPAGFVTNSFPIGGEPGNYTIELNTSNVQAQAAVYTCTFNITAIGNQTQEIDLILTVTQAQTSVIINQTSYIPVLNRKDGFDQQVEFYFNDTDNNKGIAGVTLNDIIVTDNNTGTTNTSSLIAFGVDGNYRLNISIPQSIESGWIQITVNVSRDPDYNWSLDSFTFYLRGNLTQTSIESINDVEGEGTLVPTGLNYSVYIGLNIEINFTILDTDFGNSVVTGVANSYIINYYQISNPLNQGTLSNSLSFDANKNSYKGTITTSLLTTIGTYAINITILKTNYEASIVSINLTIKPKLLVNITIIEKPAQVTAGDSFNLTLKAEFFNGTGWEPFNGGLSIITNFDGINTTTPMVPSITEINGTYYFNEITIGKKVRTVIIYAVISPAYNHTGFITEISDITIVVPPTFWDELLPFLIIGGIIIGAAVGSVAIYRGVVVPKKREKRRILSEVKTIFDDAINLEHIVVLYKGTGTCIFFKSYGSEQIDPELIGGFLTAVSSFGKEMVAQEALNEISYGDKMLLLADGDFTRVALVLGKKASLILRTHLKEFIDVFEKTYKDILPNWRGQLAHFRNAGQIVDEILNTSIILPHQISYDFSDVKDLKSPHSREVLKVAHSCCEEAGREFFFIATLLKEASDTSNKDTAEIFMGIKELRDKKILLPIEISAIEAQPISQQELNLLNQKISALTNLSGEEKQKLISDLAQLGPVEREAYLASISERKEIVSAPIKSKVGTFVIENKKAAKNGIKEFIKRARTARSKKNYEKTIEFLESAALIASNWELANEFIQLEDIIRKVKIENLITQKNELEKAAKIAVKKMIYHEAAEKYKSASKVASEIFKLGETEMTKEVKRLTNKANEFERLK